MKARVILFMVVVSAAQAWAGPRPNGMVILLTDYGADSIYVGELKGAIYTKFPDARIDSLTNSVPPFDIVGGAHMLMEACGVFPKGATFCCVVDPGVGSDRKCIVVQTEAGQQFVGPDNGLLSLAAAKHGIADLRECTNRALWRVGTLSTTFHGRDIFGPVAASLASGVPIDKVGPKLDEMVKIEIKPSRVEDGVAYGAVIRVDTYGNLITNITREDLAALNVAPGDSIEVTIGDTQYTALFVSTYGDVPPGDRLVLVQSSGFVECAANMRDLAKELGEGQSAPVTLKKK